ncbi:unnamed protein product [Prunus armeniaca]
MAGSGVGELRAPIFNGSNYDFWRIKICTIFKSHKLWDMVEMGFEPVKKEDGEALTTAQKLTLEDNIAKDAKALANEAWEILQQEFRGDKKEVIGSLKSHEQRLLRHNERVTEKAFYSLNVGSRDQSNTGQAGSSKSKKNWKSQKGKKWDTKFENSSKKENQSEGDKVPCKTCDKLHYGACWFKGKPKCYKCDRFGHIAKDCKGYLMTAPWKT